MNQHDSYDQYADQLLNSVFENVKQTSAPPPLPAAAAAAPTAAPMNPEDHFINQLLQQARLSSPFNNNMMSNEWLLLQQLQQQKQLLERQQLLSALSPTLAAQSPSPPHADLPTVAPPAPAIETKAEAPVEEKPKKIARVPVPAAAPQSLEKEPEISTVDALVKATAAAAISHHLKNAVASKTDKREDLQQHQQQQQQPKPDLQKKRSFLYRTWSRRDFKDKAQSPSKNVSSSKMNSVEPVKKKPVVTEPQSPSFWKPRGEKPKGWWKGNRSVPQQQQADYEEREQRAISRQSHVSSREDEGSEEEEEEEEEEPTYVPAKKVVVKRVAPKKVSSLKGTNPKRPMAFKTPTIKPKKSKDKSKKKKKKEQAEEAPRKAPSARRPKAAAAAMPMYVMPPQQPMYYPQPMMMPSAQPYMMPAGGGGGYYMMPPTTMMGQSMEESDEEEEEQPARIQSRQALSRKKSVYNPREASNDKCAIM